MNSKEKAIDIIANGLRQKGLTGIVDYETDIGDAQSVANDAYDALEAAGFTITDPMTELVHETERLGLYDHQCKTCKGTGRVDFDIELQEPPVPTESKSAPEEPPKAGEPTMNLLDE